MIKLYMFLAASSTMLPHFWLFLFPLRNRLRFSLSINIPIVILYVLGASLLLPAFVTQNMITPLMPLSIGFMTAATLLCLLLVKGRFIINLFYLFIIKSYVDIISMFVKTNMPLHFFYDHHSQMEGNILSQFTITLATFPLLHLFVVKLLKPTIEKSENSPFWKWIWSIPLLFYLCFSFFIAGHIEELRYTATLLPEIWLLATFLTYYLILRMLNEAAQIRKMEELLRLAEIQKQIQSKQYHNLIKDIETVRTSRHDMRHILLALNGYVQKGDLEGVLNYIHQYKRSISILERFKGPPK